MSKDERDSTEEQIAQSEERSRVEIGKASDLAEDRNVSLEGRATDRVRAAKGDADSLLEQSEIRSTDRTDKAEVRLSSEIHVLRDAVVELADKHEAQDELLRRKGILIRRHRVFTIILALVMGLMGWQILDAQHQKDKLDDAQECLQRYTVRVNDSLSALILSGVDHRAAQRELLSNPPTTDPDTRRQILDLYIGTLDENDRAAYALLDQIERGGNC